MLLFIVSLLLPCLAADLLIGRCLGRHRLRSPLGLLRVPLAVGIGLGLSSCTYFLWLFCCGPAGTTYRAVELSCFGLACLAGVIVSRSLPAEARTPPPVPPEVLPPPWSRQQEQLAGAFAVVLALGIAGMIACHCTQPHGQSDAFAIWNLRARCLFYSGGAWRQAFSPAFAHPDYPLLVPAANARCWSYLGDDPLWSPWLVGTLFTLATVGALVGGLVELRGRSQGLLGGLVLLGTVSFLRWGAVQYADVPLAFFFLATVLLLVLHDSGRLPRPGLLLAGITAGLAAWTKNEGLLFVVVVFLTRAVVARSAGGLRRVSRDLAPFVAGVLPILAIIACFKTSLGPDAQNTLLGAQGLQVTLARILDPSRYLAILQALPASCFKMAKVFAVVLPICFVLLGKTRTRPYPALGLPAALGVLCLMLAGYVCVYVITPYDLNWHLATSFDRLLTQLWPLAILLFFLSRASPEESPSQSPPAKSPRQARPN